MQQTTQDQESAQLREITVHVIGFSILWFGIMAIVMIATDSPIAGIATATVLILALIVSNSGKRKAADADAKTTKDNLTRLFGTVEDTLDDAVTFNKKDIFSDLKSFIALDEEHQSLLIGGNNPQTGNALTVLSDIEWKLIDIRKVIHVEIIDSSSQGSSAAGTLGMAAVGGLMFGGAGAVVGAMTGSGSKSREVTEVTLRLSLDDIDMPYIGMNFLGAKTVKNSEEYKTALTRAEKWGGIMSVMVRRASTVPPIALNS